MLAAVEKRPSYTDADSMGAMEAIAPTAKKLWGATPLSRPHGNFISPLYTAKNYSKITNVSL